MFKSIRLNKESRKDILANIMEAYVAENPEPEVEDNRITELNAVLSEYYQRKYKGMITAYRDSAYPDFFNVSQTVKCVSAHGEFFHIALMDEAGEVIQLPVRNSVFVDLSNPDQVKKLPPYVTKVLVQHKRDAKRISEEKTKVRTYRSELDRYRQDVKNVLEGCGSTGQLLSVWAECEKFLPKGTVNPSTIQLPTVNVAALNRKLGKI